MRGRYDVLAMKIAIPVAILIGLIVAFFVGGKIGTVLVGIFIVASLTWSIWRLVHLGRPPWK